LRIDNLRITSQKPLLLLVFFILLAYINSLGVYFIWDDYSAVVSNPDIKRLDIAGAFSYLYRDDSPAAFKTPLYFRPLQALSYMVDYRIWGLNPFGYHITSVMLHIINAILLYFLILNLFKSAFFSFWIAALFGTHPAFTPSVTYIAGRADILVLLFNLAAILFFIKSLRGIKPDFLHYGASLFCFTLALLSKETGIICLLLLIAFDKLIFKYGRGVKNLIYAPYILILLIWQYLKPASAPGFQFILAGVRQGGLFILTALKGLLVYTFVSLVPLNLRMGRSIDIVSGTSDKWLYFALIFLIIMILAAVSFRKNRLLLSGLVWFYSALAMQLSFNWFFARRSGQILIPEHNLYFCYPGLLICIFSLAASRKITQIAQRYLTAMLCGIVAVFIGLTVYLNFNWQDEVRFFERGLRLNKGSAFNFMDYANLGFACERIKDWQGAEDNFKSAAQNSGADPYFYNLLAAFYIRRQEPDKALGVLEFSKKLDGKYPGTQILINYVKQRGGRLD